MKLLIDTNVLLDMVLKRNGYDISVKLFRKIREQGILACITASSVTKKDIQDTFGQKWKDFEDCVQYMTGRNNRVDYLITANRKGYKDISLSVLTPAEWLGLDGVLLRPQRLPCGVWELYPQPENSVGEDPPGHPQGTVQIAGEPFE